MKLTEEETRIATLPYPRKRVDPDWLGHIPLARLLMFWLKPGMFVELGVRNGQSFCAFCDAVEHLKINCQAIGVDHWEGDIHTKYDGAAAFHDLQVFCMEHYPFAILWRQPFDDALALVNDDSIDLLHIDGTHTESAVAHDFETWLPKVYSRGIILFHDTCWPGGQVDVFWQKKIEPKYRTKNFIHSNGLGIVLKGAIDRYPKRIQQLMGLSRDSFYLFNQHIIHLGAAYYD